MENIALETGSLHLEFSEKMGHLQSILEQQKRASALASVLLLPFAKLLQWMSFLFYSIRHPKNSWWEVRQYWYIRKTGQFDPFFYLRNNSDVAENFLNPLYHYCRFGWRENRDPAPWFSTRFYLEKYPDVAESGLNPFYHWLKKGRLESRILEDNSSESKKSKGKCILVKSEFQIIDETIDDAKLDDIRSNIRKGLYEGE